jgi:hypothetical protein
MGLPRVDVVFRLWQCDKKNQGWREGPPLTVPCQSFDPLPGLHPPAKSVSTKKEYCFTSEDATPSIRNLAALKRPYGRCPANPLRVTWPCGGTTSTHSAVGRSRGVVDVRGTGAEHLNAPSQGAKSRGGSFFRSQFRLPVEHYREGLRRCLFHRESDQEPGAVAGRVPTREPNWGHPKQRLGDTRPERRAPC